MDTIKRQLVHETESERNYKLTLVQRCEETLHRLRTEKQPFDTRQLIQKKKQELMQLKETIAALENKIDGLESGVYDEELAQQVSNKRCDQKPRKKKTVNMLAGEPKAKAPAGVPQRRPDTDKFLEKKMFSDEVYYFKQCSKFPDHLKKNLENMPNNEGYLWREIWFMGSRPDRGQGVVLHERTREGLFLMHEYKNGYHTVYEKQGRGNKKVIKKEAKPLIR